MKYFLVMVLALITVTGCSKKDGSSINKASEKNANRLMAYAHAIHVDTEEEKVVSVYEAAMKACREAISEHCVVLESRLNTGRNTSAELKFRAKPAGIQKLIVAISTQGEIVNQSTTAEDLARPIEDTSKKLELLRDYQTRLEALRPRTGNNIDALIKLNNELAKTQSEIESLAGEKSHLILRVETEVLGISVTSLHDKSFWAPISAALSNFLGHLSVGLSSAITAVAYLVPWLLTFLVFAWLGRKMWVRRKYAKKNA